MSCIDEKGNDRKRGMRGEDLAKKSFPNVILVKRKV